MKKELTEELKKEIEEDPYYFISICSQIIEGTRIRLVNANR